MNKIEIDASVILKYGKSSFLDSPNSYMVIKENSLLPKTPLDKEYFDYIANVSFENTEYECLSFSKDIKPETVEMIFNMIKEEDSSLFELIGDIEEIFKNSRTISILELRGYFAEIHAMKEYELKPSSESNAIYDFTKNSQDVEIKSFSKVKRSINVSYQQLTNNNDAEIYALELFESSNGQSIKELINQVPDANIKRYNWIINSTMNILDIKFEVGELIILKVSEINAGVSINEHILDAKYTIQI